MPETPSPISLSPIDILLVQLLMTLIQFNNFNKNRLEKIHEFNFLESIRDILQNIYDTDPILASKKFWLPQHTIFETQEFPDHNLQLIYNEHNYKDHAKWRDGKGLGLVFYGRITEKSVRERFMFDDGFEEKSPSLDEQIKFVNFILDRHNRAATKIQNTQRQRKARKTKRNLTRDRNTQTLGVYRSLIRQKMAPKHDNSGNPLETGLRVARMGIPGHINRVPDLFEQWQKYIPVEENNPREVNGGRKKSHRRKSNSRKSNSRKSHRRKSHRRKSHRRKSHRRKTKKRKSRKK